MLAAKPERTRAVLAHEVAHVLQQTKGARWTRSILGSREALEAEAHRMGTSFATGQAPPARQRNGEPLPERLQGHDSFEHRLLGDTPTNLLTTLVAGQGSPTSRDAALASACALLDYLGANPTNPNPATLTQLAGFPIRTMTLQGSGITLTYGELNTLADFLTSPEEIDKQQSIMDILTKGGTDTTWQQIFSYFPNQVLSQGQWVSLPQWHAQGGELWNLCRSDNVFDSWETWAFGAGSHALPDLGIISIDQPKSGAFKPSWGPVTGIGIPTATLPATCAAYGSVFVFSQPAGGGTILCTRISGPLAVVTTTLTTASPGPPAAAVIDGVPTVAWVAADGSVSMASSTDGSTWTRTDKWASISGADPVHGIALAEVGGTQYVAYVTTSGTQTSISLTSRTSGGSWGTTQVVPNSSQGTFPALCSDGGTLHVAFQHGKNAIYAGTFASTWNGPASRSNVQTQQGVSLAYVAGTPYLAYWGTDKRLWWETYTNGKWSNQPIPSLQSAGPVAIGTDRGGNPCLYYSQSGALAYEARDGSTWASLAYNVGGYFSTTPPALVEFGELLYQFGTVNEQVLMSALAPQPAGGTLWSSVSPVDGLVSGYGRIGADVHVLPSGSEELWVALTDGNDRSVTVASFDGSTWTARPSVTGATAGAGDVAVAEFNGSLYVFYESGTSLCYAAWNDATSSWSNLGAVPGVASPASTTVTIIEDTLYIAYVGDNKASNYTRIYTVGWDSENWQAPSPKVTTTARQCPSRRSTTI